MTKYKQKYDKALKKAQERFNKLDISETVNPFRAAQWADILVEQECAKLGIKPKLKKERG